MKKQLDSCACSTRTQNHSHADHNHSHNESNLLLTIGFSAVLFISALLLQDQLNDVLLIAMNLVAIFLSGYSTFIRGLKNIFKFHFNMDTLMTVALIGAIFIGEWKEATLVAILFGINEWLEGLGMEKARHSLESLLKIAPKEAILVKNNAECLVKIDQLQQNDIVLVRSGDQIPSDGTIIKGISSVNEAAITGEALPVNKQVGDHVFGGTLNNEGVLHVRIDKPYEDSSLSKILHLVQEAQQMKTPTELFIQRFAKYYTPAIIIIALLVIIIPPLFLGGDWTKSLYLGLSVLIVGCPCALIISSPIALVSGITRNARMGIMIKGGVLLEELGKIDTIAFDKTGTLTKGQPYVKEMVVYDADHLYTIAYTIEKTSSHPLASAIQRATENKANQAVIAESIQTIPGEGIQADIDGISYRVGNDTLLQHMNITANVAQDIATFKKNGLTLVIVANTQQVLGIFGIADEIRPESKSVLQALHEMNINTVMLTGDHKQTATSVAESVGVSSYYSNLLPHQKVEVIQKLASSQKVAMIGDGINDAPALATAHLGIAMGGGTDSAIETADIVLMHNHLNKIPEAITIARRVNRIIKTNIIIALSLKMIALLLTIPGLLTLWIAILSDMGATIIVTLLSLTLLIQKKEMSRSL